MVARDAVTHKARAVNPLILSTPEEQALFSFGESALSHFWVDLIASDKRLLGHKDRKRLKSMASLHRAPPSQEEAKILHDNFLKYSATEKPTLKFTNPQTRFVVRYNLGGEMLIAERYRNSEADLEAVWMEDTRLEKTLMMFPQQRK